MSEFNGFATSVSAFVIGVVLLPIALLFLLGQAVALSAALRLALRGTETTGHVVRADERRRRPGRVTRVWVAYETPDGTLETRGTSSEGRTRESIPVRYLPAKPSVATTLTRPLRYAAASVPLALAVVILSAAMIIGAVFYFAGTHAQLEFPLSGGSFALVIALFWGWYATNRYGVLLRWRRMVRTDGKVKRFVEPAPGSNMPGEIVVSFQSAEGAEEFSAQAGSVLVGAGDDVTVYYDPSAPAHSATVQASSQIGAYAIASTVFALVFAFLGVYALARL